MGNAHPTEFITEEVTFDIKITLVDYQTALKLANKDGNVEMVKKLHDSIDDIQTQSQRMIIGLTIALLLTMVGFGGLMAIGRHNEAKYLRQFRG